MQRIKQVIPPKKVNHTHIGRQFLRFSKYWMNCKNPELRKRLFKQALILGEMLEAELLSKQHE